MRIELLESAVRDLAAGRDFYAGQGEGLGDYFLDGLSSDIESLRLFAGVHSVHFGRYHRLLSRRFPYAVYYTVEGDIVRVHAVLDCRRNPARVRRRLRKSGRREEG